MARPAGNPVDVEPLEEEEYQALIPHFKTHWRIFYSLLWQTGIRVQEGLNALKTDLENGGIWINREKRPKHPLRDWLPLTPELYQELYEYCHRAHRERIFAFTSQAAWKTLKIACAAAEIRKTIHPHLFRHGLGHRADRAGYTTQQVQHILGQSNPQSALTYTKPTKRETIEALKKLNQKQS